MGVKTVINLNTINTLLKKYHFSFIKLEETTDGISDTTYILKDIYNQQYIFKIYESANKQTLCNKIKLLNHIQNLPISKFLLPEIEFFNKKPIALFTYLEGESTKSISMTHISQIGIFLGNFHKQTQMFNFITTKLYTQQRLKESIEQLYKLPFQKQTKNEFLYRYELIKDLKIQNNCIIHGDLFPDNAKFVKDKLTGVFDFIEASMGDIYFDLSVVANSWCFDRDNNLDKELLYTLLDSYNSISLQRVELNIFKKYMLFASLFYAMRRFYIKYIEKSNISVKDYKEYLIKFDKIYQDF